MNAINKTSAPDPGTGVSARRPGRVSLVGAGPGAADLLTLRAVSALEDADVVYYDSLVGEDVLMFINPSAKRVFVGKRKGVQAMPQQAIQDRMRADALLGKRVVRLKGGDPFIFGRGGEELADLSATGIPVDVVPGITAGIAAGADHAIPLTHRGVATAVTFMTGHTLEADVPGLQDLVSAGRTLVVYMGLSNAATLADRLIESGVDGSVAVAVVERASLPGQRHIRSTVAALSEDIVRHNIKSPAVLIMGDVAALDLGASSVPSQSDPASFAWVHHAMG